MRGSLDKNDMSLGEQRGKKKKGGKKERMIMCCLVKSL